SSFVKSAVMPCATPPAALISPATRFTPAASTSTTATCAPSRAKRNAPARPMPEAAAVTIPIFPARRIGKSSDERLSAILPPVKDHRHPPHSASQTRTPGRHRVEVHRQRDGGVVAHEDDHVGHALVPERLHRPVVQALRDQPAAGQRRRDLVDRLLPHVA